MGLALDAHAAPTSTRWERVLVLGEDTAVVTGQFFGFVAVSVIVAGASFVAQRFWTFAETDREG